MHRTGHREKKEAVVPRRERKIEKKRERREPDGAWRRKRSCGAPQGLKNREEKGKKSFERGMGKEKKLWCPAEVEKTRRKEMGSHQTSHFFLKYSVRIAAARSWEAGPGCACAPRLSGVESGSCRKATLESLVSLR